MKKQCHVKMSKKLHLKKHHLTFLQSFHAPPQILPLIQNIQTQQLDFKILHAHTITSGLFHDPFTSSRLVEFCFNSKHANLTYGQLIFKSISYPDLYTWNAVMLGYIKFNLPILSISHYRVMLGSGVKPNIYTFALVIKACIVNTSGENLVEEGKLGRVIHGQVFKNGVEENVIVRNSIMKMYCNMGCLIEARLLFDGSLNLDLISWNSMISAYGKSGQVELGRELFERMPMRSLVSWGAMIDGYVVSGGFSEALSLFDDMQVSGLKPDAMTLVSVLKASCNLGALDKGKWVHRYVDENKLGWEKNVVLGTALVDMYAKCGCIDVALELFDRIKDKDVVLWNAMISGLALHGHGRDALELYFTMRRRGTMPNPTTFVTVLSACAHSGMVAEGIEIFKTMKANGIEPGIEHYGCLADIFGRAGRVQEAEEILFNMPMEPQASQLGALMAACRKHNNVEVGERVGKRLISLEPHDGGRYVLLSNIYAAAGRWDDARSVRREMDHKGAKKETGCSSIEQDGIMHDFIVGDTTNSHSRDIYEMLDDLEKEMKMVVCTEDEFSCNDLGYC